jgi:DNA-binding winged helix-turn-helix (wHTH) protein
MTRPIARWRIVVDRLGEMEPDETISHHELLALLGLDEDDLYKLYGVMPKARRELWEQLGRSIAAIPGVGYRIVRAQEHLKQGARYEQTAKRRVNDALAVVSATHLDELTDAEREFALKVMTGYSMLERAMESNARRTAEHDDLIASLRQSNNDLSQRVDRLEAMTDKTST